MENLLRTSIETEAKKRLSKHSRDWYYIHKYRKIFTKRTGEKARISATVAPSSWSHHKHFDPRYCLNHSNFVANGIWTALQSGTYKPIPSLRIDIPKGGGGTRTIDIFSIPDSVVARIFLDNLRIRNAKIFSDSSYAYQHQKTPLDAVIRLQSSLKQDVLFVSQYDFTAYFDSIDHKYLIELFSKQGPFLTTSMERRILNSILTHEYIRGSASPKSRTRGTPQGNSLSLFLANVAAHPLDEELGRMNGTFARFADDSVVVNTRYDDAVQTAEAFQKFSRQSGVSINTIKSSGIRIFSDTSAEMAHIAEFNFLGYKFKRSGLFMGDKAKQTIKKRCSKIIYNNLLLHLRKTGKLKSSRIGAGFQDWDLVTCINELRSFIYGGLSQNSVDRMLSGKSMSRNISGAVSYFALVTDSAVFRELDGWLVDALHRAYQARISAAKMLARRGITPRSKQSLIAGTWYRFPKIRQETRLPSFFTAWRAARKSWSQHGLGGIDPQGMGYLYQ